MVRGIKMALISDLGRGWGPGGLAILLEGLLVGQ